MPIIREYVLNELLPNQANSKVINVTGRTIVIRRADNAGRVRVKAYTKEGGSLIADNIMDAGEKITTTSEFTRLEVFNFESDLRNVAITAGDGDFQSDVVEGEVTVKTDSSNPLIVIATNAPVENTGLVVTHTLGSATQISAPLNAIEFSVQNDSGGGGLLAISGGSVRLQNGQLYSSKCSDSVDLEIASGSTSGAYRVNWVIQA
ncbi:hypothetical protein NVP1080O_16 [Vibrio phage 1.080.O._10N.286.48.A4]|uniref:Uncharacterized protein n=1 Tax=Vibrio phage 1.080.O._10N.286.48.A4 TaxID=1881315 RepID=A0A2I7QWG4_9VIRU|nr:hypothetical protein KMD67_gp16 [Vibrio phage 1.080.O._10N.286.48.A4]AUR85732.1 hypothetical protein NVP1080O_16 [Vibrio phage 1.080.O._10N.286.48.A4]